MLDLPLDRIPETRKEYTANFHIANAELNRWPRGTWPKVPTSGDLVQRYTCRTRTTYP